MRYDEYRQAERRRELMWRVSLISMLVAYVAFVATILYRMWKGI